MDSLGTSPFIRLAIAYYSPSRVILREVNLPLMLTKGGPKLIYYALALLLILIDQVSKWLIVHNFTLYESRSVIGNFFLITSHRNNGAAFSILEGQQWFFYIITVIVVIGMIWYMQKMQRQKKRLLAVAISFLLGGALGNFIDRVLYGEVVDFLQFNFVFSVFGHAFDYTFAIFNLADSAITVGVVLIFIDALRGWLKERRGKSNESYGSGTSE
jgi:signal peptidase II